MTERKCPTTVDSQHMHQATVDNNGDGVTLPDATGHTHQVKDMVALAGNTGHTHQVKCNGTGSRLIAGALVLGLLFLYYRKQRSTINV